ncbi:MAG: SCP2 sterol-binding domain-containing protein [Candidatus Competibacteraceae bacterium]|nr:SCP2 sterol-binding domain-containing protein [Candidatus Competibacteraceae bacterium]
MNAPADTATRSQAPRRPLIPAFLAWPFSKIPGPIHSTVLATALNALFADSIHEGEFEFLRDRVLAIQVRDAQANYRFRYAGPAGFVACRTDRPPDLTISGTAYDFLALATRREDSDTLFFNRRVVMAGDTALGLELKNWLDGVDLEAISGWAPPLLRAADGLMGAYERFRR